MAIFKGTIYSSFLRRNTSLAIIFPDHSTDVDPLYEDEPKVLYLLHGLGGNSEEWTRFSKIEYYAKKYNFVIIMPEADRSFYTNTNYGIRYSDYISEELPQIAKKWFNISKDRNDTYIAGESMGGYGALKIGLSHCENYAGIASLSAVTDLDSFTKMLIDQEFDEMEVSELEILKKEESLRSLADRAVRSDDPPKIIQLCGTEDFLLKDNRSFHQYLNEINYEHVYKEDPGDHEWPYWDKAIQYAFMYFRGLDMDKTRVY